MQQLNLERVKANVKQAETEDLLNRITIYRSGMESAAIDIIETELARRGVTVEQIDAHEKQFEGKMMKDGKGLPISCTFCSRPAIGRGWRWHRLWKLIPLFPRQIAYCEQHEELS